MNRKCFNRWVSALGLVLLLLAMTGCGSSGSSTSLTSAGVTLSTARGKISAGSGTTGATAQIVASPAQQVTVSVPAETVLADASGNAVSGEIATTVSYSTSAADLPAAAANLPAATTLAAFVDIALEGAAPVKSFSKPLGFAINVSASGAKAGDAMVVYSFDGSTSKWTFSGTETVDAGGSVSPVMTHPALFGVFKTAAPPPVRPSGIAATAGNGQVTVSWSPATGASSYNVYYSASAGVTKATATGSAANVGATSYTVSGLTNGAPCYLVVTAVNSAGESAVSAEVSATPMTPPAKPSGIQVAPGDGQATVSWSAAAGATSYNIYYSSVAGQETTPNGVKIANATSPQVVTGLSNGVTYYFVVTSLNGGSESGVSSEKSATPSAAPQPPASPTGVKVTSTTAGEVKVAWDAVVGAASYNVYYLKASSLPGNAQVLAGTKVSASTSPLAIKELTSGATYYVLVTAANAAGESGTQTSAKPVTAL